MERAQPNEETKPLSLRIVQLIKLEIIGRVLMQQKIVKKTNVRIMSNIINKC